MHEKDQRDSYVDRACEGDLYLRQAVNDLLSSSLEQLWQPGGGLNTALSQKAFGMCRSVSLPYCIDIWELQRLIGSGGMAELYLAKRMTAEFEQIAALKLIRLGLNSEQINYQEPD